MRNILLVFSLVLFVSGTSFAAKIGKGEIDIDSEFKNGYQKYLQALKEEKSMVGVFASDNEGNWSWYLSGGPEKWMRATKLAIDDCNKYSPTKSCRVFSKNKKILWKSDNIPSLAYDDSKYVNPDDVQVIVGSGNITLSYYAKEAYQEFNESCKNTIAGKPGWKSICFFAISNNGVNHGYQTYSFSEGRGVSIGKKTNEIKSKAIAQCMEKNAKKSCYLYADNKKVIWDFEKVSNDVSTNESSNNTDAKSRLKKLKSLYDEGLIDKDIFEEKRDEILNSI